MRYVMRRGIAPPYPQSWADSIGACGCGRAVTRADLFGRPADDQLAQVCLGCGWLPERCGCSALLAGLTKLGLCACGEGLWGGGADDEPTYCETCLLQADACTCGVTA